MDVPVLFSLNDEPINFTLNAETDAPEGSFSLPDGIRLLEDGDARLLEDEEFRLLE